MIMIRIMVLIIIVVIINKLVNIFAVCLLIAKGIYNKARHIYQSFYYCKYFISLL